MIKKRSINPEYKHSPIRRNNLYIYPLNVNLTDYSDIGLFSDEFIIRPLGFLLTLDIPLKNNFHFVTKNMTTVLKKDFSSIKNMSKDSVPKNGTLLAVPLKKGRRKSSTGDNVMSSLALVGSSKTVLN